MGAPAERPSGSDCQRHRPGPDHRSPAARIRSGRTMTHRILVIGGGNVGAALGMSWLRCGHDVRFGVPDPDDPKYAKLPRERLHPADQHGDAEIIVLAVPFNAAVDAVRALGDLKGAILIDCTNPLGSGPEGMGLTIGHDTSGAETVGAAADGASVF